MQTVIVIVLAILGLIAWDIYAVIKGGNKATISYIIATTAKRWPLIAFVFGLLMGHFFFPVDSNCP